MPLRSSISILTLAVLALAASAAAAPARHDASPGLVHRGQQTAIAMRAPLLARYCTAQLRYSDGTAQNLPRRKVVNHNISFRFQIPMAAPMGNGRWNVRCNNTVVKQGSFIVVAVASTTAEEVPRVIIEKQGYSQRPDKTGPGSQLSYGLVLRNTSAGQDAEQVYVIVNMVTATGELIGSKSRTVELVPAGGTYELGDSLALRTQTPTVKLEVTIRVGAHEPKQQHLMPDFANLRILPSLLDPGWVGEVDGEVVNAIPGKTLQSSRLSIVVFDAGGNVLGGATASSFASIPSGSRFVFLARQGFKAIPLDKAAAVSVSAEPRWINGG